MTTGAEKDRRVRMRQSVFDSGCLLICVCLPMTKQQLVLYGSSINVVFTGDCIAVDDGAVRSHRYRSISCMNEQTTRANTRTFWFSERHTQ